jgi:carbonic anhydrase
MSGPDDLIAGFRRFREQHFAEDDALYHQLVTEGQTPKVMVVACCDSRVDPALVLDCAPGDLFVIRNVANLVPPAESHGRYHGTSAALEFGIRNLGVEHVIVFGHAQCGGIRALVSGEGIASPDSYINSWMRLAREAHDEVMRTLPDAPLEERLTACEQRGILVSLDNLMTFDWVKERVEAGALQLHGWYFDMEHGELLGYDRTSGTFRPI